MANRTRTLAGLALPILLVLLALPAQAADNPRVNANTYRPSLFPGDTLAIQTSNQPGHLKVGGGLLLTWNKDPLAIVDGASGTRVANGASVTNQLVGDLFINLGLTDYLDIALGLPIYLYTTGDNPPDTGALANLKQAKGMSVGDLRLDFKVSFFGKNRKSGFGLALAEQLTFPTAYPRYFNGDGWTGTTTLIADYQKRGWNVAVNLGYRLRQNVRIPDTSGGFWVGDELLIGAGLVVPFLCGKLEGIGTMEFRGGVENDAFDKYATALDFLGGIRGRVGDVQLLLAAGGGALQGWGSPAYRITAGVSYEPKIDRGCTKDTDKDGILDPADKCPTLPGPADLQGCPDSDKDGIIDPDDRCPDVPGTKEFLGCPDTDKDGIEDSKDRCPTQSGPAKYDGCPDTDGDTVPDYLDKCPKVPGKVATNGCPDKDNDGVPDDKDKCPDIPGKADLDGCPPPTPQKVKLTADKIEILEMVFFETNKAVIKKESFGILDDVAKVLRDNAFIKKLRVEGHTDSTGDAKKNMVLSQKRAEAVREYLIGQGVAADRLVAEGFGPTRPIADNKTKEGKAQNRRVEFVITEK